MHWSFSRAFASQVNNIQAMGISKNSPFAIGYLFGSVYRTGCVVHCCMAAGTDNSTGGPEILREITDFLTHLPSGIIPVGLYTSGQSVDTNSIVFRVFQIQQFIDDTHILVLQLRQDGAINMHSSSNKSLTFLQSINTDGLPQFNDETELVKFRVSTTLEMNICTTPGKLHSLENEMARLEGLINGRRSAFAVQGCGVLIQDSAIVGPGGMTPNSTCHDLMHQLNGKRERTKGRRKDAGLIEGLEFVKVKWLTSLSSESKASTPVIHLCQESDSWVHIRVPVDAIVMTSSEMEISELIGLFRLSLCRALKAVGMETERSLKGDDPAVPCLYHFMPPPFLFPLMVSYPARCVSRKDITDSSLEKRRQALHCQFLLPTDRPLLRPPNALEFREKEGLYLLNVHEGLPFPGGSNAYSSIVHGCYSYHHYLHDKFNDDGWGCAYRSLQTIWSWFRYQGYTCLPVPTHRQIQETLVSVGDKPAKFVGSRQWIGSTEVGMCLNTLLGITYKIMFVNSGSELEDKGRELATHFQIEGTPVMIGGGVLAHTILGVDFNDKTGQIRFLILDPHYVGPDNLKTIQKDGWCGWKGPGFWDKKVHYNLCLPQRPREI